MSVRSASLSLSALGVFFLGGLIVRTAVLRSTVSHPVFLSYLFSWAIWSVHLTFSGLVDIALNYQKDRQAEMIENTVRNCLWITAQLTALGLVFHMWRMMRALLKGETAIQQLDNKWHIIPVITIPYVFGSISLTELFVPSMEIWGVDIHRSMAIVNLVITVVTVFFDAAAMKLFWLNRQKLRQLPILGCMLSLSLFARLFILCLIRIALSITCFIRITKPKDTLIGDIIHITESSYPLLVFFLCIMRVFRRSKTEIQRPQDLEVTLEVSPYRNIPDYPRRPSVLHIGPQSRPPSSLIRDPAMMV